MRLIDKSEKKEEFEPFELNLLVETPEEARTLWHLFNHMMLDEVLLDEKHFYNFYGYNKNLKPIEDSKVRDYIESKVKIDE